MINTDHLLSDDAEPDFLPQPRPLLNTGIRYLAGNGLSVSQNKDSVIYSANEEVMQAVEQVKQRASVARVEFGFKVVTFPEEGRVTIKPGLIRDLNWNGSLGWHQREHEVTESTLTNVEFPCLIYGRVPLEAVVSSGIGEGEFSGSAVIFGNVYSIDLLTGTTTKKLTDTAIPATDESIYGWELAAPVASGTFFQFRIADISSDGVVERQYAIGTVTVPQAFTPVIHDFVII